MKWNIVDINLLFYFILCMNAALAYSQPEGVTVSHTENIALTICDIKIIVKLINDLDKTADIIANDYRQGSNSVIFFAEQFVLCKIHTCIAV